MKVKKIPLRKCLGCQEQFSKKTLVRIVRNKEGHVFLDKTGKANGRGAYICNKKDCLEKALKRKSVQRALEVDLSDDVIATMKVAITDES